MKKKYPPIERNELFALLGRLSVNFSTIEAELETLLGYLVGHEEFIIAVTLLEKSTFAERIELLEKLGRFKKPVIERLVEQLVKILQPLRKRRNLFVHGNWDLSPKLLAEGKVNIANNKIIFAKRQDGRSWSPAPDFSFTWVQLRATEGDTLQALKSIKELTGRLKAQLED